MLDKIKDVIAESINVKQQILNDEAMQQKIAEAVDVIVNTFNNGKKVFFLW